MRNWSRLEDEQLLDLRVCDLGLRLEGSWVYRCVKRLYHELDHRDINFHPHVWLSSEWFSPDGVPGIAVPFYLTHPRLMRLEEKLMLQCEGGTVASCMKILRHEVGHCLDTAYRLHFKRAWQRAFGSFAAPYPESYHPRANSRRHVLHLDWWYAQAHPAEDWAETFAVWLTPGSRWRSQYRGWPALRKLETVDQLMKQIAHRRPKITRRRRVEPLSQYRLTLRQHYHEKRQRYLDEWPEFYDNQLRKLFSNEPRFAERPTAASFLRHHRIEIRDTVSLWTGTHAYTIDQVLRDMIDRCQELKLRLARPVSAARLEVMVMVTVQTMNYILSGNQRVAL
ncbi:MAG: hypothetical protein IT445_08940 [Phycisphaeraceae bacterium]|nr:hypothetical protein [Phycisphaeraceae bacterium]